MSVLVIDAVVVVGVVIAVILLLRGRGVSTFELMGCFFVCINA